MRELLDSLLWEGYALYPYTPGATKNATPTPFGIVYPPAYARRSASTYDHIELRCLLEGGLDAEIEAQVSFLAPAGERHRAEPARLELARHTLGELLESPAAVRDTQQLAGLRIGFALGAVPAQGARTELIFRVENLDRGAVEEDRAAALARSLISTHPVLGVRGGRFCSALEHPCASVNTFPVLAGEQDETMIGATIMLPDHPQIAPESRGGLFDSTEIEEALLLHVRALSDREREQIERQDPAVREMIARAEAATPEQLLALHGRVTLKDREPPAGASDPRPMFTASPPQEPAGLPDPAAGEASASVGGTTFRRGARVLIAPGEDADLQARMLAGRTGRIERILTDYDGRVHLGLTVEGDPGQELLRDSGRLLYFFAGELEVIA